MEGVDGPLCQVWCQLDYNWESYKGSKQKYKYSYHLIRALQEYAKKKMKFYFDGTYEKSNWLCLYTCTRPWNEMKLGRCVISVYIKGIKLKEWQERHLKLEQAGNDVIGNIISLWCYWVIFCDYWSVRINFSTLKW